jgi:hypothetical protein
VKKKSVNSTVINESDAAVYQNVDAVVQTEVDHDEDALDKVIF